MYICYHRLPFLIGSMDSPLSITESENLRSAMNYWASVNSIEKSSEKIAIDNIEDQEELERFVVTTGISQAVLEKLGTNALRDQILDSLWFDVLLNRFDLCAIGVLMYRWLGINFFSIRFELSWMPNGSRLAPHVDAYAKVFSGIISLANESDNAELGTRFWRYKRLSGTKNHYLVGKNLSEFEKHAEEIMRLRWGHAGMSFFLRNKLSWHSVDRV